MPIRSNWKHSVIALLFALAGAIAPVAAQSDWIPGAKMNVARAGHTATLLPDGRVLVVGGGSYPLPGPLQSAELYDPKSGTWRATAPLALPRSGHTATLLVDGRVLVVAGSTATGPAMTGELYDAATETWTSAGGVDAGYGHAATLLQDGRALVTAGNLGTGNLTYEPATGKWSPAGKLNMPRGGHTATRLQDGKVLVVGGGVYDELWGDEFIHPVTRAEIYDPAANRWTIASDDHIAFEGGHRAILLAGGKVLVAGGGTPPLLFDPATSTWLALGNDESTHYSLSLTLLTNGDVLLAGGYQWSRGAQPRYSAIVQRFDPSTSTWSRASSLQTTRHGHTATVLRDGRVLVAGGLEGSSRDGTLDSTELYAAEASAPGSIGPGFTGSWFDSAQAGHGLFVQVLPGQRFLAAWLTFDPNGAQAWFVGVGTYAGNTATVTGVEQPSGGRWIPNSDPARIVHNAWGTLTFTFADCNRGRVDFASVAGFGSGSMELTRLTLPAGLTCP